MKQEKTRKVENQTIKKQIQLILMACQLNNLILMACQLNNLILMAYQLNKTTEKQEQ